MAVVLVPALDADPTEVAVPWQVLSAAGHRVVFVVVDGRYVSARWPGDAHTFAARLAELL